MSGVVVPVVGASGGLGASTIAAGLARRFTDVEGVTRLVDADPLGGGLDVTTGIEHLAGLRWADLVDLDGPADPVALGAALPAHEGVQVLSAGRGEASTRGAPGGSVLIDVVTALATDGPVVVDLPRWAAGRDAVLARCDLAVILTGTHVRALADVDALVETLLDAPDGPAPSLFLVTRGSRRQADLAAVIEQHLGVPLLAHLADDERIAHSAERGEWPGRRRTALDPVLDAILEVARPAAERAS